MADIRSDLGHGRTAGASAKIDASVAVFCCCPTCSVSAKSVVFIINSICSRGSAGKLQLPGSRRQESSATADQVMVASSFVSPRWSASHLARALSLAKAA